MLRIGDKKIAAAYLGGQKIVRAYLGEAVVFGTAEPPVPVYTVTLTVDPEGGGVVSGGGTVESGTMITVVAVAANGYKFAGWQENGNIVSTSPNYGFTPRTDRSLTAVFSAVIPTYTVTTAIDPTGSGTATGAGTYQQGASVTVTATPADGYKFVGWKESGTTVSTSASYTFTVTEDMSLTAVFEVEKTSRLPAGYTEVEWIQNSTTSSYFTLSRGLSNSNFTIEIAAPQWTSNSTAKYIFSGGGYFDLWAKSSSLSLTAGTSATSLKTYSVGTMTTGKMVITGSAKTFTLNGSSTTLTYNNLATTMTFPYKTAANALIIRLYSFKATKTSSTSKTYNFELIPCINPSGTVGLYDLTNAEFIAPTAGTFIAGPAV